MILLSLIIWLGAVAVAIIIHEMAHALASDRLGDPTARLDGRLSFNPIEHYDPVGTTLLIATSVMAAFGAPVMPFGWAKPVMFDPYNLKNPKRDAALIAASGPVANLILAVIIAILLRLFFMELPLVNVFIVALITVNVSLAVFNLIPIHPLDGSKILYGLLPPHLAREYDTVMARYGLLILAFLIIPFSGQSAVSALISPIITNLLTLLL
ncbi:hypothetical protein A2W24_06715 [Microgenomates group bacterium RBG_16_45_19]|nr:MAG: hypothetical protein A2W24_06715 [Microgenomates group bacterium RBG_16_45_19]